MATVNTKFLANPSFGVSSVAGQALTLAIGSYDDGSGTYLGYKPIFFDPVLYAGVGNGLKSISPGISYVSPDGVTVSPTDFFLSFVGRNPIHVKKMNVRAPKSQLLPSAIEIKTPNVFTGQMDRQIINVTADSNMYQNQSNIVTLNCDVYLCRESIVEFSVAFSEATDQTLYLDITFDKYLSLEKALIENYQILTTSVGLENAINEEIASINAQAAEKSPVLAQMVPMANGGSVQPAAAKGNNFGGSPYVSVDPLFSRGKIF